MDQKTNSTSKIRTRNYLVYLFSILILVQILDSYTGFFNTAIPSEVAREFLSGYDKNTAESTMALSLFFAQFGVYIAFFTHALVDKFGRKKMLFITALGMGIVPLLMFFSVNIIDYTIYYFLIYVLNFSDFWLIYVNEEAPKEKKALWTNFVLMGGIVGALLMPLFRGIFITETSPVGAWRYMTLFSVFLGIPLGLVILFTIKETSKYELMKEERITSERENDTFIESLKKIFRSKNRYAYFTILVLYFIRGLNYIIINLGELVVSNYLSKTEVNLIITAMSISSIFSYLLTGILADKIGRRPLLLIYCSFLPLGVIPMITLGLSNPALTFILVLIGMILVNMGIFGIFVLSSIIVIEIIPTEVRGTGTGFKILVGAIGLTSGTLISSIIALYFGLEGAFLLFSIIAIIGLPLIFLYVKETKDTDLTKVEF